MDLLDAAFGNLPLLEEVFESYLRDPQSVDPSWRKAFAALDHQPTRFRPTEAKSLALGETAAAPPLDHDRRIDDLIQTYRTQGHLMSRVNPLKEGIQMP